MPNSTDNRGLKNGKRYRTSIERILRNHGSTEEIAKKCSSENVEREIPEFRTWTEGGVKEQIRGFIALLIRQLEELTRLVQGLTTSWHPNSYSRTKLLTTSATVMPQSDSIPIAISSNLLLRGRRASGDRRRWESETINLSSVIREGNGLE